MTAFVISDLHLGHKNIIKYCSRPFENVQEMNTTIINRWNCVVSGRDIVFFLGDFCMNAMDPSYWIRKLNGHIVFIKGNHDRNIRCPTHKIFDNSGEKILLVHNSDDVESWDGWIIGGHHHNSNLHKYPLINYDTKCINVSCELLNYYPIELNKLLAMRRK